MYSKEMDTKKNCTHEGSGLSGTEKKIQSVCGGAKVEKGLAVQGSGADQGRAAVEKWIFTYVSEPGFGAVEVRLPRMKGRRLGSG